MARRSPTNERYQKNTAPAGKTRKSAASAKPKRASSETANKPAKKAERPTNPMLVNPPTPEFRFWRRTWWVLLIGSALFTFASLGVRQWLGQPVLANVLLFIGYAGIFAALGLDFLKIRKMRTEWVEQQQRGGKPGKADKPKKPEAPTETTPETKSGDETDA